MSMDSALLVISGQLKDGQIQPELSDPVLVSEIDSEKVVIIRDVFDTEELLDLRRKIHAWGQQQPEAAHGVSANQPGLNFHRIDNGSSASPLPHRSHIYGFGDLAGLNPDIGVDLHTISKLLIELLNRLAGTSYEIGSDELKTLVAHFPKGGGFQDAHRHPYLPQKVSVSLCLSVPGADYITGSPSVKCNGMWIDLGQEISVGDIVLVRNDLDHRFVPFDPDAELNWQDDRGFWILANERFDDYARSKLST